MLDVYSDGRRSIIGVSMKRKEFLEKWDKKTLEHYNFVIGRKTNIPYSTGCYREKDVWYIYGVGERQNLVVIMQGNEEDVFTKLNKILLGKVELEKETQ